MCMSYLWVGMMALSLVCFPFNHGNMSITASVMAGGKAALELSLALGGSLCLWSGLARVMEVAKINKSLSQLCYPIFKKLFPKASGDQSALSYISANFSANFLGLGNAATPLGIAATKRMVEVEQVDYASDELCRLVVMNTASVQLLPTTVAALRASLGSGAPLDILPAVWVTSLCSVTAGLVAAYFLGKVWGRP